MRDCNCATDACDTAGPTTGEHDDHVALVSQRRSLSDRIDPAGFQQGHQLAFELLQLGGRPAFDRSGQGLMVGHGEADAQEAISAGKLGVRCGHRGHHNPHAAQPGAQAIGLQGDRRLWRRGAARQAGEQATQAERRNA